MTELGDTLDSGIEARLQDAWQGEVFGMAMYGAIAGKQQDHFRRWQWLVLYQLEVETGAAMRELLRRHGLPVLELESSRRTGLAEAERVLALPWHDMIKDFAADLPAMIDDYQALAQDCAFKGSDAGAMRLLVDHEIASLEFAKAEMRGESHCSINPVIALLKEPPRFAG